MTYTNVFSSVGATAHAIEDRHESDYYATDPKIVRLLLEEEKFQNHILEPMCGEGHISKTLIELGHTVTSFDVINRGYGTQQDVFTYTPERYDFDIISNPPYKNVVDYIIKCNQLMQSPGQKTALLLRLLLLEGQRRKKMFQEYPPAKIYVSSSRINVPKSGAFERDYKPVMAFAWFIWEYGHKGDTILRWFN